MDWKSILSNIQTPDDRSFEFYEPAQSKLFEEFKQTFKTELPDSLKSLYVQTNGVGELLKINESPLLIGYLILKLEDLITQNLELRQNESFAELYMPFDCLLFFSNAGNGDYFGFRVLNNMIEWDEIYCWNHETDERIRVANNLFDFLTKWVKGEIKI
jgi:SMI1 / KNR4 family (SUKH-1)